MVPPPIASARYKDSQSLEFLLNFFSSALTGSVKVITGERFQVSLWHDNVQFFRVSSSLIVLRITYYLKSAVSNKLKLGGNKRQPVLATSYARTQLLQLCSTFPELARTVDLVALLDVGTEGYYLRRHAF